MHELTFQFHHRGKLLFGFLFLLMLPAAYVSAIGDIPGRYQTTLPVSEIEQGKQQRFVDLKQHCRIDLLEKRACFDQDDTVILVIGNSHEPDALNALDRLLEGVSEVSFIYFGTTNRCGMTVTPEGKADASLEERKCRERAAMLNDDEFVARLDHVVYSARYAFSDNKRFFIDTLKRFRSVNPQLKISVFGDYIYTRIDCAELINRYGTTSACKNPAYTTNPPPPTDNPQLQDNGPLKAELQMLGVRLISKWSLLCSNHSLASCETEAPDGTPMFYDQHHLSYEFARHLGARMKEAGLQRFYLEKPESEL